MKFFNRAIMWEKEQHHPCVAISGENEDVQNIEGKSGEVGILSSPGIRNLSEARLKTLIKNFKGFELSILELRKVFYFILFYYRHKIGKTYNQMQAI